MRTLLPIAIGAIALGIIVVGLIGAESAEPTDDERVEAIAAAIKCPFCNGESLAESTSSVAGDYRLIIEERVEAGATNEEVLDEFAASFGESYILDTSRSAWTAMLWGLPAVVLIGGIFAIVGLRRSSKEHSGVES